MLVLIILVASGWAVVHYRHIHLFSKTNNSLASNGPETYSTAKPSTKSVIPTKPSTPATPATPATPQPSSSSSSSSSSSQAQATPTQQTTTTPTPNQSATPAPASSTLTNTGPTSNLLVFGAVSISGALAYNIYLRRKVTS
jgi:hypothetical protein